MDTSHWQWTVFGWEKLYSTNLAKFKEENGAEQHWLHGPRQIMKRNKYPSTERFHESLGVLNSRIESKAGESVKSLGEGRALSWRNSDKRNKDNISKIDECLDDLAEMCLSTSVIPSILLHDRLTEDLKRHSSISGCTRADPKVDMATLQNGKDVRSNYNLYSDDIGYYHHWDTDTSESQVNYQIQSYSSCDFDGMSTTDIDKAKDPSFYFTMDNCQTREMRFLDNSDLCDENLVDDLLKEIDDVDDIEYINHTEEITVDQKSIQNDAHRESEAERMKRQLSLMGKNKSIFSIISISFSVFYGMIKSHPITLSG